MKEGQGKAGEGSVGRSRAQSRADLVQLVAFNVGGGDYALDIMRIKEIVNPTPITAVPKAPPFIEGVIELRGAILPIVDVRKRFDLSPTPPTRTTKFIIVGIDLGSGLGPGGRGGEPAPVDEARRMIVGLVVDRVSEPLRVPKGDVRPAPQLATGESAYFTGVVHQHGRILMILDVDALLSTREKVTLAGIGGLPTPEGGESGHG